ncbi:hypothetical protein A2130_02250 [Candidatus Woesebacteria bacterium GWC2_33_12]|uniref:Transcriptional regulator, XRE family n=1 Tax=Candidatus Woesebacteria bacterium GW2011_GWB1_33_22 TaxID=1618566 RepID=A0A0F9ZIN3_9BACT|nr:MAG: Transcriptional regulator, XRE family [Candidatus Woesebacteria bacterium GW2011_GWC2_33_12]KKP41502.1 MAG: Transcriptional regulator, XRE family [Candidatus Woesebacteria bacterium GW2011_GWA2_33_20]KKP43939.1 MAG: Transcriptional regulator, XRE family [Candidatus Woesebacteria bacterium GW2011_GWB1_33_22]KKP45662.1 MAG: Transcriptional regulator, XRE family [Microgenomates group bacterium GW2011_GWC1_33_28]KKP49443.1 MAG: Transcriptional regulator, XRE family [Candidatus Woesebacteria
MNKQKLYTFDEDFKKRLEDPKFKKEWDKSEPERLLGHSLMEMIIKRKTDYKKLAKKTKISEETIGDIILGFTNPKLSLLKKLASSLDSKLVLRFE